MTFGLSGAAIAGIAASVGGAVISANGAKSAANTQANATGAATALNREQWQQTLNNTASYRGAGDAATKRLSMLLGLSPDYGGSNPAASQPQRDQLRASLLPNFTTQGHGGLTYNGNPDSPEWTQGGPSSVVDEAGLQAEIERRMAAQQPQEGGQQTGPSYGSLLDNPYTKPFTAADYQQFKDPGYDFMLQQGTQALQNSQAANSGVLSGAALKGLIGYNQDYANTGFQNAYGRYNDSFSRLNTQQNAIYNRLSGLASTGANAAVGTGNTGAQLADSAMGSIVAGGNARAQGTVGAANAVNSGLGGAAGYYQLNQLLGAGGSGGGSSSFGSSPMSGLLYSNGSLGD